MTGVPLGRVKDGHRDGAWCMVPGHVCLIDFVVSVLRRCNWVMNGQ